MKEGAWEAPASWRVISAPEPTTPKVTATLSTSVVVEGDDAPKGRWVAPSSWNAPDDMRQANADV